MYVHVHVHILVSFIKNYIRFLYGALRSATGAASKTLKVELKFFINFSYG